MPRGGKGVLGAMQPAWPGRCCAGTSHLVLWFPAGMSGPGRRHANRRMRIAWFVGNADGLRFFRAWLVWVHHVDPP